MSSIDERIVIIKFDNDQFEKNVAQSSNTLDKLKEKLKLDGATKGLEAVSASAKSFSFGHIGDAVDSLRDRFSTLGVVGMTVVSNLTNKITDFAMKIGGQIVSGGIKRAMNLEQANFMLEGLFDGIDNKAQKVEEIMNAANNAVRGTAYGLDEAAKVASQLVASGIQDGKRMEYVLSGIAGTAAMTGGSYEELGNIFTTVAGSGRLMTEQLRQFEHRGLNVAATLGKELGHTEAEIREMVHDGEIDFDKFANAMAEAFGPHAQEANKTFAGSLSNVKAALSRLGAKVATPELQNLRDIFNVLGPMIDAVSAALQPLIDLLNRGLRSATNRGVEALTTFFLAFGGDAETLVDKTKYMSDEAKKHMNSTIAKFADVQGAGGNFFTKLREKITGTSELVTTSADDIAKATDDIGMSAEEIDEYANRVINGEFGNVPVRKQQLEELGVSFELVQNRVNELLGCEYRYEVATDAASKSTKKFGNNIEQTAHYAELMESSARKGAKAVYNYKTPLDKIKDGFINIGSSLKTVGSALAKAFSNVFSVEDFTGAISKLATGFRDLTSKFKLSDKAAKGLQIIFEGLFKVVRLALIGVGKLLELGGKALGLVGTGIGKALEKIVDLREKIVTSRTWNIFWINMRSSLHLIGEKFLEFKDRIKGAVEQLKNTEGFQKLQSALGRLWEVIKKLAGSALGKLTKKFAEFAGTKADFSWLDAIVEFLGKAAGKLADLIDSFIDGTDPIHKFFGLFKKENTGKFGSFVEFLKTAKDAIVGFFSGLFGQDAVGNIAKGGLSQWFKDFFGNLFSGEESFYESVKNSDFVKSIKDFFKRLWEDAQGVDWGAVAETVKSIGKAILELAFVIESLKILHNTSKMIKSASGMFESIGGFFNGITKKGIFGGINAKAQILISFAAVIGTIALSLYGLSKIPAEELTKSVKAISILIGEVAGILAIIGALKLNDAQMKSFGISMAGLGAGMLLLTAAIKLLAKMDKSEFKKGATAVLEIMMALALAARIAGKSSFGTLVGMALAVDLIVPALWVLGTIKKRKLEQGIAAIFAVTMELALAARLAGKSSFGTLVGMALAVDLIVPALWVLGTMDAKKLKQGAVGLGAVMLTLAASVRIAGSSTTAASAALAMAVTVASVAVSLWALTKIDHDALKRAAIALGGTMLAISVALRIADGIKGAGGVAGFLILLGSLTLAFKLLTDMNPEAVLQVAEGLALAAVGIAAALRLIAPIGKLAGPAIVAIGVFDLFIFDLMGVLAVLGALSKIKGFNELISAGGGVFGQLGNGLGQFVGGIIGGIGEGITNSLPQIGENLSKFSENAKTFFNNISGFTGSTVESVENLAKAVLVIAGAEFLEDITSGIFGRSSIEKFGNDLTTLGNALVKYAGIISDGNINSAAVTASANAAKMLAEMASIVPNEGGYLATWIGDNTLTQFAQGLADFAPALKDYSDAVSGANFDTAAIKSSAEAAAALAEMANAVPNEGGKLAEWIGDNTLTQFAQHLKPFAKALIEYSKTVSGKSIDTAAIKASADGAAAIVEVANAVPNEGGKLAEWVTGDNTLTQFAQHLKPFGEALVKYSGVVSGGSISVSSITNSVSAASAIIKMADLVPNEGGLWGFIVGNNNLDTFGTGLTTFGEALADYGSAVTGLDTAGIQSSAAAVGTLIGIKNKLGENGYGSGYLTHLTNFGKDLQGFATPFKDFTSAISEIGSTYKLGSVISYLPSLIDTIKTASEANVSSSKVSKFASGLKDAGTAISSFSSSVSSVLSYKMQTVASVVQNDIIAMTSAMSSATTSNVKSYASTLDEVGTKLASFGSSVSGINTGLISSVASSVSQIATIQTQMQKAGDAVSGSFSSSMSSAASDGVKNLVGGLSNGVGDVSRAAGSLADAAVKAVQNVSNDFKTAGSKAGGEFANGIKAAHSSAYLQATALAAQAIKGVSNVASSMQSYGASAGAAFVRGVGTNNYSAWSAANTVANSALSGASSGATSGSFSQLGSNAMQGFINGIVSRRNDVYNYAYNTAVQAIRAAQNALRSHSPSRAFYELGSFAIQGFVNAFSDGDEVVRRASAKMANLAIKETEKPLEALQNAIDLDIDANPTITPVLDLSNIQKGAGLIGTMLGRNTPQLALAGAGAFGGFQSMVQSRTPQTDNGDVVHAINGLRDSMGNTTFNITVDGSTSPEEFVSDVVRILKNRSRI